MRAALGRHFDVVVVIWVLTLGMGWTFVATSRANLGNEHWMAAPQSGPVWVVTDSSTIAP